MTFVLDIFLVAAIKEIILIKRMCRGVFTYYLVLAGRDLEISSHLDIMSFVTCFKCVFFMQ